MAGVVPQLLGWEIHGRMAREGLLRELAERIGAQDEGEAFEAVQVARLAAEVTSFTSQAKNLEGGIGGTLDMETNRPLEFATRKKEDFYVSAAGRFGYNDLVVDFRAMDTWGEITVLAIAAIGVWGLLYRGIRHDEEGGDS